MTSSALFFCEKHIKSGELGSFLPLKTHLEEPGNLVKNVDKSREISYFFKN